MLTYGYQVGQALPKDISTVLFRLDGQAGLPGLAFSMLKKQIWPFLLVGFYIFEDLLSIWPF